MIKIKTLITLGVLSTLTACLFETPEQKVVRLAQFNGKTVVQVSQWIGPPTTQNTNTAIWAFDQTKTTRERVVDEDGIVYYDVTTRRLQCTYTAMLQDKRIVKSAYEGTTCQYYFPNFTK